MLLGVPSYQQARARRDALGDRLHVGGEAALAVQRVEHRAPAGEPHHGLVDREAGVGAQHLVARLDEREHRVEQRRLRARRDDHVLRPDGEPALRQRLRDRDAQLRNSGRDGVARVPVPQRPHPRLDDVRRRGRVGLADLEVRHVAPRGLEPVGCLEHEVGCFGPQVVGAAREPQGGGCGVQGCSYATTGFRRTPTPGISTSTTSPGWSGPTPAGVPVAMRSPGSSVITCET